MSYSDPPAPGFPGIPARWTSSAKDGIGTALTAASRVWFSHSHGILNEIYYPSVDCACARDFGLIVTDGGDFFSEEKRDTKTHVEFLANGVPAFKLTNRCVANSYVLEKELLADPARDVVLQRIRFHAAGGPTYKYRLYALLAPHLGNRGAANSAYVADYKGTPVLFAKRDRLAMALACSSGWRTRSVGYVGFSDGWQDLSKHKQLTWIHQRAENGNVALTGEVQLDGNAPEFTLALGFGRTWTEAAHRALASLQDDYDEIKQTYIQEWTTWQGKLLDLSTSHDKATNCDSNAPPVNAIATCDHEQRRNDGADATFIARDILKTTCSNCDLFRVSNAVIKCHEDKRFPGGTIASLSIPWGFSKGDDDLGGYHLAWPRDFCETAGALLAIGAHDEARRILGYLQATQEADGHWAQNMWLDGRPYWNGIQMDETAFPVLLVDLARRLGAISEADVRRYATMVRRAASYILCNGPVTQQDRWEEDAGYSPFTLSAEIAALLVAADIIEMTTGLNADYLRQTADMWYESIDRWIYAVNTDLAHELSVDGYYVRIAPPETSDAASPLEGFVAIKNRPMEQIPSRAVNIISPDALALVRFGLRRADDPRVLNTLKAIDHCVRVELPQGPCWYRYSQDGYGEHEDGRPFDGTGRGRAWPLLTGERAHLELAAGNVEQARKLLETLRGCANDTGMLPEQVWDTDDLPERELYRGRPAGSAMPLVWAHAEYIKLLRSIRDGHVFDMPPQTVKRYLGASPDSHWRAWRFNHKCRVIDEGHLLRIETMAPARIRWTCDDWQSFCDSSTADTQFGLHIADLPTASMVSGARIQFTFYWPQEHRWEGKDYLVTVS